MILKFISFLTKLLHIFPPETAHTIALHGLRVFKTFFNSQGKNKLENEVHILGLRFPNRLGLAAGMDKNADFIDPLAKLGFGFLELGTVTLRPQKGNNKPRLFRLKASKSLVNSMGFNNKGINHAVKNIKKRKEKIIIGLSIGKNSDTKIADAIKEYLLCFEIAYPISDYVAVNISSPNTKGLRKLESLEYLPGLIQALKCKQKEYSERFGYKPILMKFSPDLTDIQIKEICNQIQEKRIDGIICSNTTLHHNHPFTGGLSGKELFDMANESIVIFRKLLGPSFPIIASGGVMSKDNYEKKIELGADLVQIYTGLIYEGPNLVREIIEVSN